MRVRDLIPRFSPGGLTLLVLVGVIAALATASPAAASPASCTDNWNGLAHDGLWSDGGNWDNGVPLTTDIACIPQGASVQLDSATTNFTVAGLELDGATLTTDGSESLTITGELDLQNATPGSTGTPDLLGSGLTLTAQGPVNVDPGLDVCLAAGDTLSNAGTLTLGDGADLGGDNQADCAGASGGAVTNTGTIVSQATTTPAAIDNLTSDTGSTLDGPGKLDIGSAFSLPAGSTSQVNLANQLTLQDDAATTIGANVQVCEDASATLVIGSAATMTLGQYADLGAADTVACGGGSSAGQVTDLGTILVPGTATIAPGSFDNQGAVDLTGTTGILDLKASSSNGGSGDTGTYAVPQGTTLEFDATSRIIDYGDTSGTTFSGRGTLILSSASETDFASDADLSTLNRVVVSPGAIAEVDDTLEGPSGGTTPTLTINGDIDGYGFVTIPSGTVTTLNNDDAQLGEGVDFVNNGAMTVVGSVKACIDEDATLENAGTLALGASSNLGTSAQNAKCEAAGSLVNDQGGSITSAGSATISTGSFDNAGTVTVGPGSTLVLDANSASTDTGSYAINATTATLSVLGGVNRVLEGTISGPGRLSVTGGNTLLEVMPDASGSMGTLTVGGGATLQLDAGSSTPLASSTPALSVTGAATFTNGTVAFNGDALTSPDSTQTLGLLSFTSHTGTPSFPQDDNGWQASFGTVGSGSGVVATITPVPPQSQTPPTISGSAVAGGTLTVTQGTWSGTPTHLTDQWEDCDPYGDPCTAISGATGPGYSPTQNDVGNQIEVVETASNAGGSNTIESAMTDAVTTLAPVNLSPPEINGDEGTVGEILTEMPGAWQNNPSIGLQWEDCDITGTACTAIPGATGASYTTTGHDVNDSIVVVETGTNSYGSAQASSDPTEPLMDLGAGGFGQDPTDPTAPGSGRSGSATVTVPSHAVSGTDLSIALRCTEQASCPVTITLTATEPATAPRAHAANRGRPSRSPVVVVGSQWVRIAAGDRRTVTVSLNRTGSRLLASAHTLRTTLIASNSHSTLEKTSVTFTAPATDHSKHPKHRRSTTRRKRPGAHHTRRTRHSRGHPGH